MFLVDSHCHLDQLDLTPYGGDLSKALEAAYLAGVQHMLCVCITLEEFPSMLTLVNAHERVSASLGLHPNEKVKEEPTFEELIKLASSEKVIAIGETGLDYYRSEGDLTWQKNRFRSHIAVAKQLKKPLIIHSRQAKEDTLSIIREEKADEIGGVLHCFTEDWDMAKRALDLNFYISFSGIVTFNNAKAVQEVAKKMPLDRLLIETDSPYLAPVPFRGKSNEPAFVRYVAEYIATLRDDSLENIARVSTENFFTLFKAGKHVSTD